MLSAVTDDGNLSGYHRLGVGSFGAAGVSEYCRVRRFVGSVGARYSSNSDGRYM